MVLDTKRRITVEEFEAFTELPENADKVFEFIGEEIVEKVPSNAYSSKIAARIIFLLSLHIEKHQIEGHVTGEAGGYQILNQRYAPDVAYLSKARQAELDKRGYNSVPPELAVEVVSPDDKPKDVAIKVGNYLAAGVVVWVVYTDTQEVLVYAPNQEVKVLGISDILDGGAVLPNLKLPVKDIFRG